MNFSCALENLGNTNSTESVNLLRKVNVINRSEQNFVSEALLNLWKKICLPYLVFFFKCIIPLRFSFNVTSVEYTASNGKQKAGKLNV